MVAVGGVVSEAALATVTVTGAEVAVLPAASRAARSACGCRWRPSWCSTTRCRARWCPRRRAALLSTRNCTPATPTLSVAVAVRVTVPETVALGAGAVMVAVGGVVSPPPAAAALKVATCMTQAPLTGAVAL